MRYTGRMQGTHLMTPQSRLMLAAGVFAVLALIAFFLVWKWPSFFGLDEEVPQRELTIEEKLDVLDQVQDSSEGPQISSEEKQDVIEQVAASSESSAPENDLSEQEKLDILDSLNNP